MYSDTQLLIANEWGPSAAGKTLARAQPRHRRADRHRRPRRTRRPGPCARRRQRGLQGVEPDFRRRALQDHAPRGRPHPRAHRPHRDADGDGAGQAVHRGERRDIAGAGEHRVDGGGGPALLRPRDPGPPAWRVSDVAARAGRRRGRVHALELPDQPGGQENRRRAGRWLRHHRQGPGGDAGQRRRTLPRLRGRGHAARAW